MPFCSVLSQLKDHPPMTWDSDAVVQPFLFRPHGKVVGAGDHETLWHVEVRQFSRRPGSCGFRNSVACMVFDAV